MNIPEDIPDYRPADFAYVLNGGCEASRFTQTKAYLLVHRMTFGMWMELNNARELQIDAVDSQFPSLDKVTSISFYAN